MGANSSLRKIVKSVLYPLTNEKSYKYVQAVSKAWDIKKGTWSEPELDLLKFGLHKGETGLDIGANFGVYAYYMSKIVGKYGKVYCFEPVPFTFETLSIVATLLGFSHNTELVNKGCSNENGKIKFSVPMQESGAFSTGQAYIESRNDDREGKKTQVRWRNSKIVYAEIVRLDDFLPEIDTLPFIKIDIEGAELLCAQGSVKLIEKHLPTVICEINPWFLQGFNIKLNDLVSFFTGRGYKIFHYINQPKPRLREVNIENIVEDNYVFIHPKYFERFSELLPK